MRPSREIRAVSDGATVRVYQAYNDAIADAAVAANGFASARAAGLWKERMTWVKPSRVWMGYRAGWTTKKDRNQARVLVLDLAAAGFRAVLRAAAVAGGAGARASPVVVQWDPERVLDAAAPEAAVFTRPTPEVRSLQVGLRGAAAERLLDPEFLVRVADVTDVFRAAAAALEAGDEAGAARALAALGDEAPWSGADDAAVRAALEMDP